MDRLGKVLAEMDAEVVAIPEIRREYLERGHAVRFRCRYKKALGVRVDVMTKMCGVTGFAYLWERRQTIECGGLTVDVMSLRDWLMIRSLVERACCQARGEMEEAAAPILWRELKSGPESRVLEATAGRIRKLATSEASRFGVEPGSDWRL